MNALESVIARLIVRPDVRAVAIENFLFSSMTWSRASHADLATRYDWDLANLAHDARLYRWNEATVRAIRDGLKELRALRSKMGANA